MATTPDAITLEIKKARPRSWYRRIPSLLLTWSPRQKKKGSLLNLLIIKSDTLAAAYVDN